MADLKEKLLEQRNYAKVRQAAREAFYKSEYCKLTHKNVVGKVIYYIQGEENHEEAGLIQGVSKDVEGVIFGFWDIGVNDVPFKNCDLRVREMGEWNDAIEVTFDAHEGKCCHFHINQDYFWADNIRRVVKK